MMAKTDPMASTLSFFSMRKFGVMVPVAIAFLVGWGLSFGKRAGIARVFVVGARL